MEKKITKKDRFNQLLAIEEVANNQDLVAFIQHEIELLDKKSSKSGLTKEQKANEEIKAQLLLELSDSPITITELRKTSEYAGQLSCQKVSALFKQLVESKLIERTVVKGVAYFALKQ